jgi:hypothetical protein
MTRKTKVTPCDLTTIDVQGSEQEVFEVYESPAKEMTLGFVFDEKDAAILYRGQELVNAVEELVDYERNAEDLSDDITAVSTALVDRVKRILKQLKESND